MLRELRNAQASSLGFNEPDKAGKAVSFRKREGGPIDLSDQQQQRRASIELGMTGASRSSLCTAGAFHCCPTPASLAYLFAAQRPLALLGGRITAVSSASP